MKRNQSILSLFLSVLFPLLVRGRPTPIVAPVTFTNGSGGPQVAFIGGGGAVATVMGVSTGTGLTTPGQIDFLGAGTGGGSLTLTAPSAFTGGINQTWTFPPGAIPSGLSLLQLSNTGGTTAGMNYATLTGGGGISLTQSSGSIMFSLGSSLSLGSTTSSLNDSTGVNHILGLVSSGSGNYVTIANDTTTTIPPSGPQIRADGPGTGAIPIRLTDRAGGGFVLESNGGLAMKVVSSTASPAQYVRLDATPSLSTFAGGVGTQIASANPMGTSDISLALKAQGNGYIAMQSNVDSASAYAFEAPVDTTTTGVTKGRLVWINSSGTAANAPISTRPVVGVALNTATTGTAVIATSGRVYCNFDVTPTVGHYVELTTVGFAGQCRDAGAIYSSITAQIIGTVLDTSGNIILRIGN